ncbi:SLC13 family permease [Lacrimispora xylanisolvens]|uniref:GntT/GntP/DsdX family permease n=1 Tax=Lacrimispora xylanisolvens TaxID=384636 RepID=UPI003D9CA013
MNISAFGAIIALVIAIILILKKVEPTYAMIFGAIFGGLLGGAGLAGTVSCMITGVQGIVSAIVRIVTAGILAGVLIESGAAARIAEAIIRKMGSRRSLIAIMLATWCLTAVGVFGDVAVITVAPIAIQLARRSGFKKLGVLMALIGGVKAGNVMSPNPNAIAASEAFHIPLTSTMMAGIVPAVAALITTTLLSRALIHKGSDFDEVEEGVSESELPSLAGAVTGPLVTIILLLLRPLCGITVDPLIALPAGGISGVLAMRKGNHICFYFTSGLKKMSGVAMLLIGTGTLAGIISNSNLKDVIIQGIEYAGLPGFLLAPYQAL